MNNKGQTIVIFVLLMPFFLLLATYIVDMTYIAYHSNRLNEINDLVIKETNAKKLSIQQVNEYVQKNDSDIYVTTLNITNEIIEIGLTKEIKSLFGNIIGKKTYVLTSNKVTENTNGGLLIY